MKPSIKFLQKVKAGKVYRVEGYSMRRGGYTRFVGGEAMYKKHREAGYVRPLSGGGLGSHALATLTEKGEAVLEAMQQPAGPGE